MKQGLLDKYLWQKARPERDALRRHHQKDGGYGATASAAPIDVRQALPVMALYSACAALALMAFLAEIMCLRAGAAGIRRRGSGFPPPRDLGEMAKSLNWYRRSK